MRATMCDLSGKHKNLLESAHDSVQNTQFHTDFETAAKHNISLRCPSGSARAGASRARPQLSSHQQSGEETWVVPSLLEGQRQGQKYQMAQRMIALVMTLACCGWHPRWRADLACRTCSGRQR